MWLVTPACYVHSSFNFARAECERVLISETNRGTHADDTGYEESKTNCTRVPTSTQYAVLILRLPSIQPSTPQSQDDPCTPRLARLTTLRCLCYVVYLSIDKYWPHEGLTVRRITTASVQKIAPAKQRMYRCCQPLFPVLCLQGIAEIPASNLKPDQYGT